MPQALRLASEQFADHVAIQDGEHRITYRELRAQTEQAAVAFRRLGLRKGGRAAIWAPNIHQWVVAAFGVQLAGGALVPLNTRLKGTEAGYILRRAKASFLFTVEGFLGNDYLTMLQDQDLPELQHRILLEGARPGAMTWSEFLHASPKAGTAEASPADVAAFYDAVTPDDVADILFTSGTTGAPKGAVSAHSQNLRCYEAWSRRVGLSKEDRYLIINPFFHSFGYKAGLIAALIRGATVYPQKMFDAEAVLERIQHDRITFIPGPPTLYYSLLASPKLEQTDMSSLRVAVTGAAVVPVQLIERMEKELRFRNVMTAYGLTETCGTVTCCQPGDSAERISTTAGKALDGVEVKCVDAAGAAVPAGEAGEVLVRGYNVMKGYLDDPAATAEAIDKEGWLHTGDVGVLDAEGYLRITDRIKDMFIVGGFNCYPAEIESLLLGHPEIAAVAVVGVTDERMGEVGQAWVVRKPGKSLLAEDIIAWSRQHMANYKVPRYVEFVEALPMNASGKVQKFLLRKKTA